MSSGRPAKAPGVLEADEEEERHGVRGLAGEGDSSQSRQSLVALLGLPHHDLIGQKVHAALSGVLERRLAGFHVRASVGVEVEIGNVGRRVVRAELVVAGEIPVLGARRVPELADRHGADGSRRAPVEAVLVDERRVRFEDAGLDQEAVGIVRLPLHAAAPGRDRVERERDVLSEVAEVAAERLVHVLAVERRRSRSRRRPRTRPARTLSLPSRKLCVIASSIRRGRSPPPKSCCTAKSAPSVGGETHAVAVVEGEADRRAVEAEELAEIEVGPPGLVVDVGRVLLEAADRVAGQVDPVSREDRDARVAPARARGRPSRRSSSAGRPSGRATALARLPRRGAARRSRQTWRARASKWPRERRSRSRVAAAGDRRSSARVRAWI